MMTSKKCNSNVSDIYMIDTHTHFDANVFDPDRESLAIDAYDVGVREVILIGYLAKYFDRMIDTKRQLDPNNLSADKVDHKSSKHTEAATHKSFPNVHLASGLHPAYIAQHTVDDLDTLADFAKDHKQIAIGEIGLDTFTDALKQPEALKKQKKFFNEQLDLAVQLQLPALLHIRKAHAECLALLKSHDYDAHCLGGIAHSFSGGEQEAKAFAGLGFKLGITGQVTNPNAKKLRRSIFKAVDEYGLRCLVIETDCPDMTPISCQSGEGHTRNIPANLLKVLHCLSKLLDIETQTLAKQLWQNSCEALRVDWDYPSY